MIINLLLLIPIIGSIVISMIPVSELSEKEAKYLLINSKSNKIEKDSLNTQEVEKFLKQENYKRTRNLQIIGLSFAILNFLLSIYV